MVKLCLMASHGYPTGPSSQGLVFCQKQNRVLKDCQPYLPSSRTGQDMARLNFLNSRPNHQRDTAMGVFHEPNPVIGWPVLVDVQDSALLSLGIAKQCTKQEKILHFLMSGSVELEKSGLDFSLLPELMELQRLTLDVQQPQNSSLIYPSHGFDAPNPLVDFMGDMANGSKITIHQDGRVLLTGSGTEIKDILSIVAEFYLSKNATKTKMPLMLVPHFSRVETSALESNILSSSLKIKDNTAETLKSAEKIKLKPASKKKNNAKRGKERDLYKRSYFHACESLLSLMMGKKWDGKATILSLKKSGPELPELLTQFSVGIAGTGLALILSIICKAACGRVPFCASKLIGTGFGFGLFWLSWAVNKLRDTVVLISKNTNKLSLKDKEMIRSVDKDLKDIYFRAATLMAVALLRFA